MAKFSQQKRDQPWNQAPLPLHAQALTFHFRAPPTPMLNFMLFSKIDFVFFKSNCTDVNYKPHVYCVELWSQLDHICYIILIYEHGLHRGQLEKTLIFVLFQDDFGHNKGSILVMKKAWELGKESYMQSSKKNQSIHHGTQILESW